jgi:5-methylcytosine-specific restriction endonuclease McrA
MSDTLNFNKLKKERDGRTTASRSGIYTRKRWRTLRATKIAKNPICELCLSEDAKVTPAEEVHHLIPCTECDDTGVPQCENFWDIDNLQSLCVYHHRRDTRREHSKYKNLEKGEALMDELEAVEDELDQILEDD